MKTLLMMLTVLTAFAVSAEDKKAPEWMKYTIPGEAHKTLDNTAGTFTYTMKMWEEPNGKVEEATGTSENKWILKGRYLHQTMKGKVMGQDFEGIAITGYDNFTGEYQTIWMDDMVTGMAWATGANSATSKTIKQAGAGSNPMKNEKIHKFRTETVIKNRNEHSYYMYANDKSGKEYKTLDITYKRK